MISKFSRSGSWTSTSW